MQTKIIEALLVIVLFCGGWFFIKQQSAKIDQLNTALESAKTITKNYDISVKAEDESRKTYLKNLREFADNENSNRAAVAAGTKQLSVKATCPKAADAGSIPGVAGAFPVLTADAGQDYFLAKSNIKLNEEKQLKCYDDLKSCKQELSRVGAYACK